LWQLAAITAGVALRFEFVQMIPYRLLDEELFRPSISIIYYFILNIRICAHFKKIYRFFIVSLNDCSVEGSPAILNKNITGIVNISDINAPSLRNHLELLQRLAKKEIFNFKPNNINEREISISSGILENAGWKVRTNREEGFLELLE
jgi:hypothetical protein